MSKIAIAEKILMEKEAIAKNVETIYTKQTGRHLDEGVRQGHEKLAEFIGNGLTLEDDGVGVLLDEWLKSARENVIEDQTAFEHSFDRFLIFKDQILEVVENQVDEVTISSKELIRILRKIEKMVDKAAYAYVRILVGNFEGKVNAFEESMKKDKQMIAELSVPIIPSIVPNTILVPIVGLLTNQRFEILREKLLNNVSNHDAESIVCDFTGAVIPDNGNFYMDDLAHQIEQITKALSLMGVEIIYVGFSSRLVQEIVRSGVTIEAETFSTFKTGLKYLANQKKWNFNTEYLDETEEDNDEFEEKEVAQKEVAPTLT